MLISRIEFWRNCFAYVQSCWFTKNARHANAPKFVTNRPNFYRIGPFCCRCSPMYAKSRLTDNTKWSERWPLLSCWWILMPVVDVDWCGQYYRSHNGCKSHCAPPVWNTGCDEVREAAHQHSPWRHCRRNAAVRRLFGVQRLRWYCRRVSLWCLCLRGMQGQNLAIVKFRGPQWRMADGIVVRL